MRSMPRLLSWAIKLNLRQTPEGSAHALPSFVRKEPEMAEHLDFDRIARELGANVPIHFASGSGGIELHKAKDGWSVQVEQPWMAGRAVGLIQANADAPDGLTLHETPVFDRLGVMLDCSRNAVPRVETVKHLLRILSRMGFSTLQLYMEDVFQLADYPYFGYGRMGYTDDELTAMDDYAASLGIELIPAVQTLAHLMQTLKWDAMRDYVDVNDILLADDEKTMQLIDAIFAKMRKCFRTNRINIGMDEAHMLGLGNYLQKHGFTDRTQLILRHFERVHALANKYGFRPMLWSDMFFRLAAGGEYYQANCKIDASVGKKLPEDTTLIYWDYYSFDQKHYDDMLSAHLQITPNIAFAAGARKSNSLVPCNHFSIECAKHAFPACKARGIRDVFVTVWGDNGAEASLFSVLPTLQYWAELCWRGTAEDDALRTAFSACTDGNWDDFLALGEPVFTPDNPKPGRIAVNASKTLLYEDILTPLISGPMDLPAYAAHLEECLAHPAAENPLWRPLFDCSDAFMRLLLKKCVLTHDLHTAWQSKDCETLRRISENALPELCRLLNDFIRTLHARWLWESKPAGMDVLDLRLGGMYQRFRTTQERLNSYLNGEITTIDELDIALLPLSAVAAAQGHSEGPAPFWHRIVSASSVAEI